MCNHRFTFPEDKLENYNPDGKTLTGWCECGAARKAYGMRWSIPVCDKFLIKTPYGEPSQNFDLSILLDK